MTTKSELKMAPDADAAFENIKQKAAQDPAAFEAKMETILERIRGVQWIANEQDLMYSKKAAMIPLMQLSGLLENDDAVNILQLVQATEPGPGNDDVIVFIAARWLANDEMRIHLTNVCLNSAHAWRMSGAIARAYSFIQCLRDSVK